MEGRESGSSGKKDSVPCSQGQIMPRNLGKGGPIFGGIGNKSAILNSLGGWYGINVLVSIL